MTIYNPDAAPYRPDWPPPGVAALRAGVRCLTPGHPAVILTARGLGALTRAEERWRCPRCGRAPFGVRDDHQPRRPVPAQPVGRPDGSPVER